MVQHRKQTETELKVLPDFEPRTDGWRRQRGQLSEGLGRVPPAPRTSGRLLALLQLRQDVLHVLLRQILVVIVIDLRGKHKIIVS